MAKMIKETNVEMPVHYGPFPPSLPVFKTQQPGSDKSSSSLVLEKRIHRLQTAFGISGVQQDAGDRVYIQDKDQNRVLQLYKTGESYLYYDRNLVSPTDPKFASSILSQEAAKKTAELWLGKQDMLDENAVFQGWGYTGVTAASNAELAYGKSGPQEYRTEIKACFGFRIRQRPVLGPGAKILVSYTGEQMSQLLYFWRIPERDPAGEMALIAPETLRKYLASDPRFAQLDPLESKIRITDIVLGYYALPPFVFQTHYFPVYQIKGIVETRGSQSMMEYEFGKKTKASIVNESLQYNFNFYTPAGNLDPKEYRLSGFPQPLQGSLLF